MRLHHINIAASASILQITMEFYRDVLGLRVGPRPKLKSPGFWLYYGVNPIVHLSESDIHSEPKERYHLDHVAFADTDLKSRLRCLEANGVEYVMRIIREEKVTQIFFYDPCGNRLELNFLEILPGS